MVSSCHSCNKRFSMIRRKHHCRNCGNIFCYNCSSKYIVIPDFIADRPDPADYWNISYYIGNFKKEERVCDSCYDIIKEKQSIVKRLLLFYKILDLLKISINYLNLCQILKTIITVIYEIFNIIFPIIITLLLIKKIVFKCKIY